MEGLPTEGTFGVVDPITLFCHLWRHSFSGAVKIEEGDIHRIIYVNDSKIASVATNHPGEKIDEILISQNKITREHIRQALEASGTFAELSEKLVEMGFITPYELKEAYAAQVMKIISLLSTQPAAVYSIIEGYTAQQKPLADYPIPQLVSSFFSMTENRDFVISILGNPEHALVFDQSKIKDFESLEAGQDADQIIRMLNGNQSMAETAAQSKWKEFDVYRFFALLLSLGLVTKIKVGEAVPEAELTIPEGPPAVSEINIGEEPGGEESEDDPEMDIETEELPPIKVHVPVPSPETTSSPKDDISSGIKPIPEVIKRDSRWSRKRKRKYVTLPLQGIGIVIIIFILVYVYVNVRDRINSSPSPKTPPLESIQPPSQDTAENQPSDSADLAPERPDNELSGTKSPPSPDKKNGRKPAIKPAQTKPSPSKPAPQVSSSIREKASAYLTEARSMPDNTLTIQLMIACMEDSIQAAESTDASGENLWYVSFRFKNRNCFKVFWGRYETNQQAEKARENLPERFRTPSPPQIVDFSRALAHVSD